MERSAIIFENVQLLKANGIKLESLVASIPCLATIMETDDIEEASELVDFIAGLRVKRTHMLLYTSVVMNAELLTNKTINFNVIIVEKTHDTGDHYNVNKKLPKGQSEST